MNLLLRLMIPVLLLAAGWRVFHRLEAEESSRPEEGLQGLERAIRWDPTAPRHHFLMGISLRDLPQFHDPARAREHLERAAGLNPYSWRYRLELARLYELTGRVEEAAGALEKAVELNPRSGPYRWRLANVYLRNDSLTRALPELAAAIEADRSLFQPALDLLLKAGGSFEQADAIWPADRDARLQLLRLACAKGDPAQGGAPLAFLREQWRRLEEAPEPPTVQEGAFYLEHLLRRKAFAQARQRWIELARRNGIEDPSFRAGRNLVWNGDFERPLTQGPLDWRLASSTAYSIELAEGEGFQGSTALRIDFKGLENLNFSGVGQQVVVEPGLEYELGFRLRSEDLTSEQGIYLEVVEAGGSRRLLETEPVLGTTSWTAYGGKLYLSEGSTVWIRLRRKPSQRIDNLLRGRLWLDDVRLVACTP